MTARLFSKTGALAGSTYTISDEALIGRDAQCDITLYLHTVSSRHARIFLDAERQVFMLEDLGSSNGTYLDKTRVDAPVALDGLHVITFAKDVDMIFQVMPEGLAEQLKKRAATQESAQGGRTTVQDGFVLPEGGIPDFKQRESSPSEPETRDVGSKTTYGQKFDILPDLPGDAGRAEAPEDNRTPARDDTVMHQVPPADGVMEAMGKTPAKPEPVYRLVIDTVKETGRQETLNRGMNTLGRGGNCSIVIPDEYMSGRHAAIRIDENGAFLIDLESRNGTFLEEEKVESETPLPNGATIRLGPTTKAVFSF